MTLNLSQMDQKKLEELARESNLLSTIDESYASMQTQNPSFDQGLDLKIYRRIYFFHLKYDFFIFSLRIRGTE